MSAPIEDQVAAVQSAIYLAEHAMLSYAPNSELHLEQIKKRDALRSVLDTLAANNREVERRRLLQAALIIEAEGHERFADDFERDARASAGSPSQHRAIASKLRAIAAGADT